MRADFKRSRAGLSRRDMFQTGGLIAAGLVRGGSAQAAAANTPGPGVYTRIGYGRLSTALRLTPSTGVRERFPRSSPRSNTLSTTV
jgi:hypothetical protein